MTPAHATVLATTATGPANALTISFVALDNATRSVAGAQGLVDLGTVSANLGASRKRSIVVRRRVAVRIDSRSGTMASARLSVALTAETPGSTVRIDGVTLSTVPRMINPAHRTDTAVVHEIELTIPASVPEGAFHNDLEWIAESD